MHVELKTPDERHYGDLLTSFDSLLHRLGDVLDEHEDCPGCDLCRECEGIFYALNIFKGCLDSHAPPASPRAVRAETTMTDEEGAALRASGAALGASASGAEPAPDAAELPAAKDRPYWLG